MDWQPIRTAPKDGTVVRVRGRDWGKENGKYHYANAEFTPCRSGNKDFDKKHSGFTDILTGEFMAHASHWQAAKLRKFERQLLAAREKCGLMYQTHLDLMERGQAPEQPSEQNAKVRIESNESK